MAKIGKLLDKTVREDGTEAKKWIVVVGIVVGTGIAGVLFLGIYVFADVDEYLYQTKDISRIYDFYDLKYDDNELSVFFIGSSVIGDAVHCYQIDDYLKSEGYNISTYNLLVGSDSPLQRSLQTQNIINISPDLIVYGLTYRDLVDDVGWNSEKVILTQDRISLNKDTLYLYTEEQLSDIYNKPDFFYKKVFLENALKHKLNISHYELWGDDGFLYSKDPFYANPNDRRYKYTQPEDILKQSKNVRDEWRPVVTNESTQNKEALIYMVKKFQDSNIPVIIINTPLHPYFSEKITNESRNNMFNLLNETGAIWYDMETFYNETYFRDSHHATFESGKWFSKHMADLIIEQVENDVIHYT
ncbi:MAG: hypothetical protein Q4Q53_03620 [Methanocorpusculum sp.]|nr:hypothetical protein [Methanocorpusculum sp.]